MPTRISRYLDGVMEAAWLAAVILVPVFFNVYSNRIFEPDKIAVLRSLALVILAAWLAKLAALRSATRSRTAEGAQSVTIRIHALGLPVAGLALVTLIATALSLHPAISLWGSYQRLQGTYTFFSYLVISLAMAVQLRTRAQVERLLSSMILASLPVGLYGVLQRFGLDPVPWGGNVTSRITANLGNSIFLAAYLIMAFPPTAVRCVTAIADLRAGRGPTWPNLARASTYVTIAGLQLAALVLSGSRGPLLGWLAGVFFLFVVLSMLWQRRSLTLGVIASAMAVTAFLVVFNLPNTPLKSLRAAPGIGRLGALLDAESKTGRVRTLIWQGAARLVLPHPALEYPDGRLDAFNPLRPLTGYGPESMLVAFNRFYPPELTQVEKRNATPDRAHNETWDVLINTGLLGLIAYLALFGSIFYFGLKWLGLIPGSLDRNLFLGLFLGLGAASALGFVLWQGAAYFGVGLPFGMIAGLILYLMISALRRSYESPGTAEERWRTLILVGALAAIVAHFVEVNFGIAIAATRLYFWTFTALLVAVGIRFKEIKPETEASPPLERLETLSSSSRKKRRASTSHAHAKTGEWASALWEAAPGALLSALALISLGYGFLSNASGEKAALSILGVSLFQSGPNGTSSAWVFLLFLATWLLAGILFSASQTRRQWVFRLVAGLGLSAGLALIYFIIQANALASLSALSVVTPGDILELVRGYEALFALFSALIFVLVLSLGYFLGEQPLFRKRTTRQSWSGVALALISGLAAITLVVITNLRPIQADVAFKQAEPFRQAGAGELAAETTLAIYSRAHQLAPAMDTYLLHLGSANLQLAQQATDPVQRDSRLAAARQALEQAQKLNPLNPDHAANLARLYTTWAGLEQNQDDRLTLARAASEYFEQAVSLSPNNARLWDEWAALALGPLDQPEAALERLNRSLEIDPQYDWTHALLGEYWSRTAGRLSEAQAQQQALETAAAYYQQALQLADPADTQSIYTYLVAQAAVYLRLERLPDALAVYQWAIDIPPPDTQRWQLEEAIAQIYAQLGDLQQALEHAAYALAAAPPEQQPRLTAWIDSLKSSP